jgi:hypothetical protein
MTTPTNRPDAYTITITSDEADLIGVALGKLPLEQSITLWMGLKGQVMSQQYASAGSTQPAPEAALDATHTSDQPAG